MRAVTQGALSVVVPLLFWEPGQLALRVRWPLVGLVVVAAVLLAGATVARRQRRGRTERITTARRRRYEGALRGDWRSIAGIVREGLAGRPACLDLVRALDAAETRGEPVDRAALGEAVVLAGAPAVLRRQLRARRAVVRGHAALLVGRLRLPDGCALLGPQIADTDPDVSRAALEGVARQHDQTAVDTLLDALADKQLPPERIAEWLGAPWAVEGLLRAVEDPRRAATRGWCMEALGLAGDRSATAALCAALRGEGRGDDQAKAARALGRLGDPAGADALIEALGHEEWAVRAQAARALERLADPRAAEALRVCLSDRAWWVRANAANALRALGGVGEDRLRDALRDPDRYARERAAEALSMSAAARVAP